MLVVQRAGEGVVGEPALFALTEARELGRACGAFAELAVAEALPTAGERGPLDAADQAEVDAVLLAGLCEAVLLLRQERAHVLAGGEIDVHRLQRVRAVRAVRALKTGGDLVERQE